MANCMLITAGNSSSPTTTNGTSSTLTAATSVNTLTNPPTSTPTSTPNGTPISQPTDSLGKATHCDSTVNNAKLNEPNAPGNEPCGESIFSQRPADDESHAVASHGKSCKDAGEFSKLGFVLEHWLLNLLRTRSSDALDCFHTEHCFLKALKFRKLKWIDPLTFPFWFWFVCLNFRQDSINWYIKPCLTDHQSSTE